MLFIVRQRTASEPLLPYSMFRATGFNASNVTHMLIGGALIIGMVTVPLMANTVLGLTALDGGLMLMRMTVAIPVGAVLGGLACQRMDLRIPSVVGLLMVAVGFGLMSTWGLDIADPIMALHLATVGLGFGLLIAPIALVATESVDVGLRGAALRGYIRHADRRHDIRTGRADRLGHRQIPAARSRPRAATALARRDFRADPSSRRRFRGATDRCRADALQRFLHNRYGGCAFSDHTGPLHGVEADINVIW